MKLKRFTTQLAVAGLIALPLAAHAAGLGKLSVKSALGQPLSAEIELFAADKAELESLSATLASDQAFRDAHVEFAPILSSLSFSIAKKPNGKAVLKVTSSRPVSDPFVDLLIELNWSSGRLVREYTMLLDPPGTAKAQAATPVAVAAAQTPSAKPAPEAKPAAAPVAETPAPAAAGKAADEAKAAPDQATTKRGKPQPAPAPEPKAAPDQVTVRRGDTLGNIASRVRPQGVSLEQTLLGLYRENPRAFDGNMNRLKSGKTLSVPSSDAIAAIPQKEAAREIKLQADDWRAYRQKLAGAVSAATPEAQAAPSQASSGKITPKVEDRAKPAAEAQKDVLKLSKAVPPASATKAEAARAADEDATAHQKSVAESSERVAMLEKQIGEMQKLAEMKETAKAEPAAEPAPAPAPAAAQPAPAPAAAEHKPVPAPAVQAPPAAPEPSENWYDPLLADPLYWGGALAALGLGGVLWWMMAGNRRRKPAATALEDSIISVGEMRPVAAAAPAASGGSINTGDTSFLTDFSQAGLGAIDTHDVDPIAEAEVYMAYGRDAQAEEILKEAIAKNPDRHEVRVKLLEIYAARRNATAFEAAAGELYASLGSKPSPLWDKACEMGRSIDPTNPLYGGGQPSAAPVAATVAATAAVAGGAVSFDTAPAPAAAVPEPDTIFDLLDLAPEPARASEPEPEPVIESAPLEFESAGNVLNFDVQPAVEASPASAPAEAGYVEMDTQGLNFDLPDLDLPAATNEPLKLDLGQTDDNGPDSGFDFSGLDLDLAGAGNELELDEVGTKLDLARAYVEMGDKEGAREILNEVLNEGNDKQRADAKGMMSALG